MPLSRRALVALGCTALVSLAALCATAAVSLLPAGQRTLLLGLSAGRGKRIECPSEMGSSACLAGSWQCADSEIDGDFWPSRSTHYGRTEAGACGFSIAPNCRSASDTGCQDVPADILADPAAGKYAAPQGDYYAQTGRYLSCGECFEVRCADAQCQTQEPVLLRIADSCPCNGNPKWCCAKRSQCTELGLSTDGTSHCTARGGNSTWDDARSIHLDLNDLAMAKVALGPDKESGNYPGVINTFARRVSCRPRGNVYILTSASLSPQDCYLIHPQQDKCFSWFAVTPINVAGAGTVTSMQFRSRHVVNGTVVQDWVDLVLDTNGLERPQEQFGQFKAPWGLQPFFPMTFRMRNRLGQEITTQVLEEAAWKRYWDSGVQFPAMPAQSSVAACDKAAHTSAGELSVTGGSAVAVLTACWASLLVPLTV
eukprot:m51a1_g8328 hypothetical protein (426) ;mRNA; f:159329-160754